MSQYTGNTRRGRGGGSRSGSNYNFGTGGGKRGYDQGRSEFMNLLLFYILPFVVVNLIIFILVTATPKGSVTITETNDYTTTTMELKVKSLLPVKAPVVTLSDTPLEIRKTGSNTYTAVLTSNGVLKADLVCINQMKTTIYEQVNILDDIPPVIDQATTENGILSFHLEDSQSGIDYSSIYAIDNEDGQAHIPPLSIDQSTGFITFDMKTDNLTVCAKDRIGNELRMTFDPNGNGVETPLEGEGSQGTGEGEPGTKEAETGTKEAETGAAGAPL